MWDWNWLGELEVAISADWKGISVRPARPFAAGPLAVAGGFHPSIRWLLRAHPCRDRLRGGIAG